MHHDHIEKWAVHYAAVIQYNECWLKSKIQYYCLLYDNKSKER